MNIINFINKKASLQIYCTLLIKKEIQYTTQETLISQMPFKCDKATFRRHIIGLIEACLVEVIFYEDYKVIKLHDACNLTKKNSKGTENKKKLAQIEKKIYAEYDGHTVKLKDKEHDTLLTEYGEDFTKALIEKLLSFKASKNKKYESDYMAIRQWVITAVEKDIGSSPLQLNYKDKAQVNFMEGMRTLK